MEFNKDSGGYEVTLWVVRCGEDAAYELEAYDKKFVGIGWGQLGDLSAFTTVDELRESTVRLSVKRNSVPSAPM